MQVRKVIVSSVMMGAIGAAGLGLAGTASATTQYPGHHKSPPTSFSAQKTVVRDNGQVGNGNVRQTSNNSANITNNQNGANVAIPVNAQAQVPLNVGLGVNALSPLSSNDNGQTAKQWQKNSVDQSNNYAENYTSANSANGNGNHSETNIGQDNHS